MSKLQFAGSIAWKVLASSLVLGLLQPLCADTLMKDAFDRGKADKPVTLDGTTPTQTGGTAKGAKWSVSQGTATTNGSGVVFTALGGNNELSTIPLAPAGATWAPNSIYTVHIKLPYFTPNGGDNWLDIGIASDVNGLSDNIGALFIRGPNSGQWTYNGNTFAPATQTDPIDSADGTEVTITLNTATRVESFYFGASATGTPDFTFLFPALPPLQSGLFAFTEIFNGDTNNGGDSAPAPFPASLFEVGVAPIDSSKAATP